MMSSGLFKKLILCLSVILVLGGIGFAAHLNHNDFERSMVMLAQDELMVAAKAQAQDIAQSLDNIRVELEILSNDQDIQNEFLKAGEPSHASVANPSLVDSYKDVGRQASTLYLINPQGVIVNGVPFNQRYIGGDLSGAPEVKELLSGRKAFLSRLFQLASDRFAIAAMQPVFKNGEFLGLIRAEIPAYNLNILLKDTPLNGSSHVLVLGHGQIVLSYPDENYIGQDALMIMNRVSPGKGLLEAGNIVQEMRQGKEGRRIIPFISTQKKPQVKDTILVYTPIHIGRDLLSILVTMDYSVIAGPVNRNARDNILFAGFVVLVLLILGIIIYRIQKRNVDLAIKDSASAIINRQLRLEVEDRREIEAVIRRSFGKPRK